MLDPNKHGVFNKKKSMSDGRLKQIAWLSILVINIIIWYSIFTNGFFITLTWLIVISAIFGLWLRLTGRG